MKQALNSFGKKDRQRIRIQVAELGTSKFRSKSAVIYGQDFEQVVADLMAWLKRYGPN